MSIVQLDSTTKLGSNIIEGDVKYKTPILINKEIDFMLEIANPTLDVFFSTPTISGHQELSGRFDDVLHSLDFDGSLFDYDSSDNYIFDSVIVKHNPNIDLNLIVENSNFSEMLERILEDTIIQKVSGNIKKESIQIAEIVNHVVRNISNLSAKTLLLEYENPSNIIDYFTYASISGMKSHLLQKSENLILLYELPFRLENVKFSEPEAELAVENKGRVDIHLNFGIKFTLNTTLTEGYYDAIGLKNGFY